MQRPLFPLIAAGDISAIINLALHELGLSEGFLLQALMAANGKPKTRKGAWDFERLSAFEWMWICQKLHLSPDCLSVGYFRLSHKVSVGAAILNGAYVLPITEKTWELFLEYLSDRRRSIRGEAEHYGPRLLEKMKQQRYDEARARRNIRKHNLRIGQPIRVKLSKLYVRSKTA